MRVASHAQLRLDLAKTCRRKAVSSLARLMLACVRTSRQDRFDGSVVAVADVAIEPDVDLPGLALCLHEVGQHAVRALGHGLDVPPQHLHEVGYLLAQTPLIDGHGFAVGDDDATVN